MGLAKKLMMEKEEREAVGYKEPQYGLKYVCADHFSNQYLRGFIKDNSVSGKCSYCKRKGDAIDLALLISHMAKRFTDFLGKIDDQNLYLASSFIDKEDEDERIPGFRVVGNYIVPDRETLYDSYYEIAKDFDCLADNDELNEDIGRHFYVNRWIRKDPVSLLPHEAMKYSWGNYVSEITDSFSSVNLNPGGSYDPETLVSSCRKKIGAYGFEDASDILHDCIDAALYLKKTLPTGKFIYRGRPDFSGQSYDQFTDLTSAPSQYAKANRLSQAGESVFYGSFDEKTPIEEILNYTEGTKPVISLGKFETVKDLTLIDFTDILRPDFWMGYREWQIYLFLLDFHEAITKSVSDTHQYTEYVPTQTFIYMLRKLHPNIDGIIYKSSLTSEPNICLFYDNSSSAGILKLITAKAL